MCESMIVGGRLIETIRDARAAMPNGLVFDADMSSRLTPPQDGECLCWVDMKATAERNGFVANNQHGGDPFEWHFLRSSCQMAQPDVLDHTHAIVHAYVDATGGIPAENVRRLVHELAHSWTRAHSVFLRRYGFDTFRAFDEFIKEHDPQHARKRGGR